MKTEILVPGAVGVMIGIVLTLVFTSMSGGVVNDHISMMGSIDSMFIEQMIPHHEDAIVMADLALEKAKHDEIKELATDIKRTQSEEIEQMKTWYKDWFGDDVPNVSSGMGHDMGAGMMNMGMMGDSTDIDKLETAADFDKAFIEDMIPHHQMAVMMAQMLQETTNRPEMEQLAKNIINAQTLEIDAMREWYRQWYGE